MSKVLIVRDWDGEAFHRQVLELEAKGYTSRLETYSITPEMDPDTGQVLHLYTLEMRQEDSDLDNTPGSFLALIDTHEHLNALFLLHQEALLALDIPRAQATLEMFERELRSHMRFEEELLLPVYARAGRIPGGPCEFFTGEHEKMLAFIARFKQSLAGLEAETAGLKQAVIKLFDDQATFKHLVEHHDLREQNILYPTLDKVTSEAERRELLSLHPPAGNSTETRG